MTEEFNKQPTRYVGCESVANVIKKIKKKGSLSPHLQIMNLPLLPLNALFENSPDRRALVGRTGGDVEPS